MLNKILIIIGTLIVVLILVPGISAGVKSIKNEKILEEKNKSSDEISMQKPKSQLRCWQYGKLIFDEKDWDQLNKNTSRNTIVYRHKINSVTKLFLMNVGTSTCLYEKTE